MVAEDLFFVMLFKAVLAFSTFCSIQQEQQAIIKTLQNKLAADYDKLQSVMAWLESIEEKMASGKNKYENKVG